MGKKAVGKMDKSRKKINEKESIIVVDDDEITCRSLELVFIRKGYESEIARTGSEAIEKVRNRFFNIALLDIKLPDIEGTELLKTLKKIRPLMSVIMITGYASLNTAVKAMNDGASGYINKPVDMDEVFVCIKKALEKQRLIIQNRRLFEEAKRELARRKEAEKTLKESRDQLRSLSSHLQTVREEERRQLAREIHDELGQTLTALKMNLSSLSREMPKGKKSLIQKAASMSNVVDKSIQTVRRISTQLRPELLDILGLPAAIECQAEEFQSHTGIICNVQLDGRQETVDWDRSLAIFRIVQEALTNVARHANATKVDVRMEMDNTLLRLRIIDNGKGIVEEDISSPTAIGLIGMRERVFPWGGKVRITGQEGKGTTVRVSVPLNI